MWRDLPLYIMLQALPIAAWLSQCMHIGAIGLGQNEISSKKLRSHSTSSPALFKAMNSDFIVEWAIHVCLDDFQDIAPSPIVKTYPLVDFVSVDPVIQLASLILQEQLDICCNVKHSFGYHLSIPKLSSLPTNDYD